MDPSDLPFMYSPFFEREILKKIKKQEFEEALTLIKLIEAKFLFRQSHLLWHYKAIA
jgi:hypothetical protein